MTMNMPPHSNQGPSYLQRPPQGFSGIPSQYNMDARYEILRPSQENIPNMSVNRSYSPSFGPGYNPNRSYSPLNAPNQMNSPQTIRKMPLNVVRQNVGGQYLNQQVDQGVYQQTNRSNNFIRQPQVPPMYPQYGNPNIPPVYTQQSYSPQPHYQPPTHATYQPHIPQPYNAHYYPHVVPQTYAPLYPGTMTSPIYNQTRRNIPEQSINSNFSYENANFDCNYSVQENLVHCVLCNQTYKTSQKRQHLELHREKVRNVNIRPVDEQQLKRLQKYNAMTKKGLMVKPIVEPDEFNVQYNPNQFVLRKVTQYKDLDAPRTNEIQIQTEDPNKLIRPQDLGYSESHRSQASSPERGSRMNRISENPVPAQRETTINRNTNTRFNSDSVRGQEQIFLSDRFDHHDEGQTFKSNYHGDQLSLRESERRSQASQLGYQQGSSLKARNAESINEPGNLGYNDESSRLHSIKEDNEEYRNSNKNDIPIAAIINQVHRESQY